MTPSDWLPTEENLAVLPAGVKQYIHALETNADPAGTVRQNVLLRDEVAQLRALVEELQKVQPAVKFGEYVLATKFHDGDPADRWAVGFYASERDGRHYVNYTDGRSIHVGGYRRVGRISQEMGRWLLANAAVLESAPPGVNLWGMIADAPIDAAMGSEDFDGR